MPQELFVSRTLPVLATTEHLLPQQKHQIRGRGMLFSHTILEAIRSEGMWIVMQGSDGETANKTGDIVTFATIENVDWLSEDQVIVELELSLWGRVDTEQHHRSDRLLKARFFPLWHSDIKASESDRVVTQLQQWQAEYACHQPLNDIGYEFNADPCWLCWRWLELLPLPVQTKQRLLKQPEPTLCLRYLKKMIRQSDRYTR
ncbi:hypothetical protein BIT28_13525 [Photobacterium proteolyticum]|uniref:Lon protease n=1 Tax=Photobacterium proteolyticum TaxID=1903952 RepID=A0A1Q9GMH0_9GAMM|nr:hypothetical protein [Photobacterium proteolyticum]OLQ75739.1 hypothetical protein BIT28_13525 [Photobacterium proteolyticum]